MANKGFFILTDISGYTEFLTKSEIDHANDALQNLFEAQISEINYPFVISGYRGDAIFMYVPETDFQEPQTFLEALERLYIVFADTRQQIIHNTTCTCRACRNISKLDLKMVIHYGEYVIQKLGDREELLGADVIVPHRMLKNHVLEKTGIDSYALFSDSAVIHSELMKLAYPLVSHEEEYEHIGKVNMQVLDLHKVWEREQEKHRLVVTPEEAWLSFEWDSPHPLAVVWEYLTTPRLEKIWAEYDLVERTDSLGGRMQTQSTYHCAHGELEFFNKVLDWKPFEYVTIDQTITIGARMIETRRVQESGSGTKVFFYLREPFEPVPMEIKQALIEGVNDFVGKMLGKLDKDKQEK